MLRVLQLESDPQMLLAAINTADYKYVLDDDVAVDEIDYADYSDDMIERINRCGISRCRPLAKRACPTSLEVEHASL